MTTNDFFKKISSEKPIKDMYKIYKRLELKTFVKKQKLCIYGEEGDKFYIIVKGEVGICVPSDS